MAVSNTGPQLATKKRCRMCNSSNPVAATSCDICGCAFEQPVFVNVGNASAAVVYPSSAGAAQPLSQPAPQPRPKPAQSKPAGPEAAQARAAGQPAARGKPAQPKAPAGGPRRSSSAADMAQFLRGADDPGVAAQPTWSPMLAWVVVSFVVLVFAVVATAILMAGSTVNGLTR